MATSCTGDQSQESVARPATNTANVRGILKKSSSIDQDGQKLSHGKEMKWDEMNILQTYHPADKDYGHQKITDPPTPYSHMTESDKSGDEEEMLDPSKIADCLKKKSKARVLTTSECSNEDEEEEEEDLSEEAKAKKSEFRKKRKMHYDEYYAVKMRQQMLDDEDDDEDDDVNKDSSVNTSDLMQTDSSDKTVNMDESLKSDDV